jgi:hypothetical protein
MFFPLLSISQGKYPLKLDEINISVNSTYKYEQLYSDQGRIGFGSGIYFAFFREHRLNFRLGIEYNRTGRYFHYFDGDHFSYFEHVTFYINNLSFPFELRLTIGQKTKFFIESGIYLDYPLFTRMKGTLNYTDINYDTIPPHIVSGQDEVNTKISGNPSFGAVFGAGVIIPGSKVDFIIKSDYKLGINDCYIYGVSIGPSRYIQLSAGIRFKHTGKKPQQ